MVALVAEQNTPRWLDPVGHVAPYGVKSGVTIFAGAMVALNAAGFAVPAVDTAAHVVVGIAQQTVRSPATDADGAQTVETREGIYRLKQPNAQPFVRADIGDLAFVADDATVQKAAAAANDIRVGRVYLVDDQGVWCGVGISHAG